MDISPGIRGVTTATNHFGLQVVTRPDGMQTLSFYEARPSTADNGVEHDKWVTDLGNAVLFITTVGVIIATVLSDGALFGVSMMVWGVVNGAFQATVGIIDAVARHQAPAITEMILNITSPITWSNSRDFLLSAAELGDSLRLIGNVAPNGK